MSEIHYLEARLENIEVFREDEISRLQNCVKANPLINLLSNPRWKEESGIDFVYTSAQLEGNTYSRADTISLLKANITAGGKPLKDAQMIVNLRAAYDYVLEYHTQIEANPLVEIRRLHKILMRNLLPEDDLGKTRTTKGTKIGGTGYLPPTGASYLDAQAAKIAANLLQVKEPFSRSLYAACNISYLQLFEDGNKRTSRVFQNAILLNSAIAPLLVRMESLSQYLEAQLSYYETGDYIFHRAFMLESYEIAYPAQTAGVDVC